VILSEEILPLDGHNVPLTVVQSRRARRYILRFRPDGTARLVVPRSGSVAEARRFARQQEAWILRQAKYFSARPIRTHEWVVGSEVLLHGRATKIEAVEGGSGRFIRLGTEMIKISASAADLRPAIEKHLRRLATAKLPGRTVEHAARHGLSVRKVIVRNQRTRWGSCSAGGTISLNWRLIQVPDFVSDYVILHELMHLRQMNHSARFWREVAGVCPDHETARRWLKEHGGIRHLT